MLKEKTKELVIDEKRYEFTRLDARAGSYIAFRLMAIAGPAMMGSGFDANSVSQAMLGLGESQFFELQKILLRTVRRLTEVGEQKVPEPVVDAAGDIVIEDLKYDALVVTTLMAHAAVFNCGDFFDASRLKKLMPKV